MTILKKLIVKGIRSYNPKKEQIIDFQSPLTLIIGQNGTGKTTIIECLKYITTGTLPPNSKGGAFIYDGGLANNLEVKAEIKLHLFDFYNREVVIQKILQTSIKQTKTEQKILEFNVWVNNDIKEILDFNNTIKSTINKFNKEDLTSIFDINTSILENVIFCHQDDSMWYLSEPATIKKKYDEIFSSTRYAKILDNLKKTKKDVATKIKVLNTEINYLLKAKDKKNEIEKKILEAENVFSEKSASINLLEKNSKDCIEMLKNLTTEQSKIKLIVDKKNEIENQKTLKEVKYKEEECNKLIKTLNIEELKLKIENLEKEIQLENKKIEEIEKNREKYEKLKSNSEIRKIKQDNLENIVKDIKTLQNWLEDQKVKFCKKLKICDEVKSCAFDKCFSIFFDRYEKEWNRKNEYLIDLKTKNDRLIWEIEKNNSKIKELEYLSNFVIDETLIFQVDDIDIKILELEKEYEKSIILTREIIINEEKIKKRDELLKVLQNKTKSSEIENIKNNTEKIKFIKQDIRKFNNFLNKLEIKKSILNNHLKNYNSKIYEKTNISNFDNENNIFLDLKVADELLKLGVKTKKCFLCEKDLDNCHKYSQKIQNLKNNKIDTNKVLHEANFKNKT